LLVGSSVVVLLLICFRDLKTFCFYMFLLPIDIRASLELPSFDVFILAAAAYQ